MKLFFMYLGSILSLFLLPIKGLLCTMIVFITLDTITGIYVSVKLYGISSFQSTKFFNLVVKSFFYLFSIIMAYFLDAYILEGAFMGVNLLLSKAMTAVWIFSEIKSIDENSMKLGNKSMTKYISDLFTFLKGIKKDLNELKNE
jgi:phage-related holin